MEKPEQRFGFPPSSLPGGLPPESLGCPASSYYRLTTQTRRGWGDAHKVPGPALGLLCHQPIYFSQQLEPGLSAFKGEEARVQSAVTCPASK